MRKDLESTVNSLLSKDLSYSYGWPSMTLTPIQGWTRNLIREVNTGFTNDYIGVYQRMNDLIILSSDVIGGKEGDG